MICDSCGESEATIHQIHVADNEVQHLQLCESCAKDQASETQGAQAGVAEAFSGFQSDQDATDTCPECGMTLSELRKVNRVGCEECYRVFRDQFESLVHRIHGADQHVTEGSTVAREGAGLGKVSDGKKRKMLEKRLQKRVEEEEYERAAELRDRLEELDEGSDDEPAP